MLFSTTMGDRSRWDDESAGAATDTRTRTERRLKQNVNPDNCFALLHFDMLTMLYSARLPGKR